MAKQGLDKETRKAIRSARKMIEEVARADGNEAETRQRVERIFESLMGYDALKHLSREHAVRGAGETEHCDFAVQVETGEAAKPVIMVELKRVNVDLAPKHLKQVSHYAINAGCEWILLTNGREWRLYHVSYGQPPETKIVERWNLLEDEPAALAKRFELVSYHNVKKGALNDLWEKRNVLTPRNVLGIVLSEGSIRLIRRELKSSTGVAVTAEEIVGAVRRLLNDAALKEMDSVKITLPERKRRSRRKLSTPAEAQAQPAGEAPKPVTPETPAGDEPEAPLGESPVP